jgi:hypothetical protein
MDGSPSSVISVGFGTWGSTGLVLTLGLGVGEAVAASGTASWQYAIFAGNKGHAMCELNKPHAIWAGNKGHVASNDQP